MNEVIVVCDKTSHNMHVPRVARHTHGTCTATGEENVACAYSWYRIRFGIFQILNQSSLTLFFFQIYRYLPAAISRFLILL